MSLTIFNEDVDLPSLQVNILEDWFNEATSSNGLKLGDISVIFCSDSYLLNINQKYLNHDYYTDIITFNYSRRNVLSGDLFISLEMVVNNAAKFSIPFDEELHRVMIHGLLHLIGFDDHTEDDIAEMRFQENYWLSKIELNT
ncbi:rRNA maturation RNase YbeY [Geofilum sp. OHC36d9]|uniref:rRNA maturation RNase YbeY n=1 Tax=Geofilum sp. OHC36d9 TaxID=3458413 RepID=UPI00403471B6